MKEPLAEVVSNSKKFGDFKRSGSQFKSRNLLNIMEVPEEEAKTPQYVSELRKQNGEDVKKTGLEMIPRKLESLPKINLGKYLKDLQSD